MSNGNRRAAIAAGLVLLGIASALAQQSKPALKSEPIPSAGKQESAKERQTAPAAKEQQSSDLLTAIKGIEAAIRDHVTKEDKAESERKEKREVADLEAQKEQALWAERMTWAAWGSVILSFVGLLMIGGTLYFTYKTAKTAERALVDLERPHVFVNVKKSPLRDGPTSDRLEQILPTGEFGFAFNNVGRSPAFLIELYTSFAMVHPNDIHTNWPLPIDPDTQRGVMQPAGAVIAANKDNEPLLIRKLTVTESSRLQREKQNLFFIGYVRYRDILGNTYTRGFCLGHDRADNHFVLMGDERYNYERKEPSKA